MNNIEKKLYDLLTSLVHEYGAISVKAEFEAEGTRTDELLRLAELGFKSGSELTIKIGGCEAVRDLIEAKQFGASSYVAPMVESAYALEKYSQAISRVFEKSEIAANDYFYNIETSTAFNRADELVSFSSRDQNISGIVFGRVDFSMSMNIGRSGIEGEEVTDAVCSVASLARNRDLKFVVGGAISPSAIGSLRTFSGILLSRFETRKVVFDGGTAQSQNVEKALLKAAQFELGWLLNKQKSYESIVSEDSKRIQMLMDRLPLDATFFV